MSAFPGAGTERDPIRCSSTRPEDLAPMIAASYKGVRGSLIPESELAYWIGKASHAEEYSDLKWRLGWNRYWEDRMRADNIDGASDPKLGDLPALYQPGAIVPPPPVDPPTPPAPFPTDYATVAALALHDADIKALINMESTALLAQFSAPLAALLPALKATLAGMVFEGEARIWGQTIRFTMRPKV